MTYEIANGISISDDDVINRDNFIAAGQYNPHNVHPFVFHDSGFVLGVVFESNLQDAFDELADSGKIDHLQVTGDDWKDYGDTEEQASERLSSLGNAGELFDIDTVSVIELANPAFSFVAMLAADKQSKISA